MGPVFFLAAFGRGDALLIDIMLFLVGFSNERPKGGRAISVAGHM